MKFGEKIKRMRVQREWNQETFAVKAGLSRATIYNVEATKWHTEINNKTLKRVASAFGVSVTELIANVRGENVSVPDPLEAGDTREPDYDKPPPFDAAFVVDGGDTPTHPKMAKGLESLPAVIDWFKTLPSSDQSAVAGMLLRYSLQKSRENPAADFFLKLDMMAAEALNKQKHKPTKYAPKM